MTFKEGFDIHVYYQNHFAKFMWWDKATQGGEMLGPRYQAWPNPSLAHCNPGSLVGYQIEYGRNVIITLDISKINYSFCTRYFFKSDIL